MTGQREMVMSIRCFARLSLLGIFVLALCLVAGCGGAGSAEQEKPSDDSAKKAEQKKESPKKAEQKKDNASVLLGKWKPTEQCERVTFLRQEKGENKGRKEFKEHVEFLQGGKLLIGNTGGTYNFLDSSRIEVSKPQSASVIWTFSKPSNDVLRIEYDHENGPGLCVFTRS